MLPVDAALRQRPRARPWPGLLLLLLLASASLGGCGGEPGAAQPPAGSGTTAVAVQPGPTTTPNPSPAATPTATPTPTATATATHTPPATATPWPTPDGMARQARVPILMYHYLSDPPPGADKYRQDLSVSPALFEQHLAYLKAQGYHTITLYDLLDHLTRGAPLPPGDKPVILTFDDGYRDNYENALPLLQRYGFTATFFVLTEVAYQQEAEYLTWDMMHAMQAAGMDVECHARVHEDLTGNDDARLVWQVLGCREAIESELGQRPRFVAYPSGRFDDRVASFFASDNYWGGLTTQQGAVHSSDALFQLQRLRVRNTTSVELLAELLTFPEPLPAPDAGALP